MAMPPVIATESIYFTVVWLREFCTNNRNSKYTQRILGDHEKLTEEPVIGSVCKYSPREGGDR